MLADVTDSKLTREYSNHVKFNRYLQDDILHSKARCCRPCLFCNHFIQTIQRTSNCFPECVLAWGPRPGWVYFHVSHTSTASHHFKPENESTNSPYALCGYSIIVFWSPWINLQFSELLGKSWRKPTCIPRVLTTSINTPKETMWTLILACFSMNRFKGLKFLWITQIRLFLSAVQVPWWPSEFSLVVPRICEITAWNDDRPSTQAGASWKSWCQFRRPHVHVGVSHIRFPPLGCEWKLNFRLFHGSGTSCTNTRLLPVLLTSSPVPW